MNLNNKYVIVKTVKNSTDFYSIKKPDGSIVNNITDSDLKKVQGYLERLEAMGCCEGIF